MNHIKTQRDWRKDLSDFHGLTEKERAGFLPVLEWFENYRLRRGLEAGGDAVDAFWRSGVVPVDRPWESRHLEQWKRATDWYLKWLNACAEERVHHKSLATRVQAAVRAAGARRGMASHTGRCYSMWVKRYAAFAGSEREMKRKNTAIRFMELVMQQDKNYAHSSQKQAFKAVQFFFNQVCGMDDVNLDVLRSRKNDGYDNETGAASGEASRGSRVRRDARSPSVRAAGWAQRPASTPPPSATLASAAAVTHAAVSPPHTQP